MIARAHLVWLALLAATQAAAQSSLGGGGALPPPRPVAPASQAPAEPARPAAPSPARPPSTPPQRAEPSAARPASPPPPSAPDASTPRAAAPAPRARPAPAQAARPPAQANPAARPQRPTTAARNRPAPAPPAPAATPAPVLPPPPPPPTVGSATGLALPRFAALGSNQVNLRVGPDTRYLIEWTYQRRDLPVQIIDEHQNWRRIRDPDGTEGWVQRPLLATRRTFLARGDAPVLRRRPEADAPVVARLQPGVIGRVRRCAADAEWCEAEIGEYRGYLRRDQLWGVAPGEVID